MMDDEFLNQFEEEVSEEFVRELASKCMFAYKNMELESMWFSEEEFELLIDHYIYESEEMLVYTLSEMAYRQHPYSKELLMRYADALIVNEENDGAIELLNTQLIKDTHDSDLYYLLAKAYLMKREDEKVFYYMEKSISLSTLEDSFFLLISIAQDYLDEFEYDKALIFLQRAEIINPENTDLINDLAFTYERLGKLSESIFYYEKYIDSDTFNDNAWFNLGTLYARTDKLGKAIESFDYALSLNPDHSSVLYNKGILLINAGRMEEARDAFDRFCELEPRNIGSLSVIADSFFANDELDDAYKYYKITAGIDICDDNNIYSCLAYISLLRHENREALEYLEKIMGKTDIDYNLLVEQLRMAAKRTNMAEYRLYYIVALYFTGKLVFLEENINLLMEYNDACWLDRLLALAPELKHENTIKYYLAK